MKNTDLRLGNYIRNKHGIISKIGILAFGCQYDYQPIQLTEEILLKCGFVEKYKSVSNRWSIGKFELHDCEDENGVLLGDFIYNHDIHIKHLHQLQNLYFALTDTELTINL